MRHPDDQLSTDELQRAVDVQLNHWLDDVAKNIGGDPDLDAALLIIGQLRLLTMAVRGVEQSLDAALDIRTVR